MARADSTVRVNIIGDAKSLIKAAAKSEAAVGGIGKSALKVGGIIAGAFVTDAVLDFGQSALNEADRVGDAAGILEAQLGDLAQPIIDAADEFDRLGASEGDMLELEVAITNVGTALGLTKEQLAGTATEAATTAAALALITDTDADTWIDQIGKAAGGSERALKALGVSVTDTEVEARALAMTGKDTADALTDSELAAARLELILEKLAPRLTEVTTGTGDLEQKQRALQAKMETLSGKIGEHLEGPLNDLLEWVISGITGFEMLGDALADAKVDIGALVGPVKLLIAPFLVLNDVIAESIRLLGQFFATSGSPTRFGGAAGPRAPGIGGTQNTTTINVQGGSPEAIEQAVRRAVLTVGRRG